jgi:hypothetical protein
MKITTDCKNIQDFCQTVGRSIEDAEFTYINLENGNLTLHAQTSLGTVSYSTQVESSEKVSVGVFTKNLTDTFKKLYGEEVELSFGDKVVRVQKDNIKVSLPITSAGLALKKSKYRELSCDSNILTEHLIKSVDVLDKLGFTSSKANCVFIDNSHEEGSYICSFSDWAFRIAKIDRLDVDVELFCVSEKLAKVLKYFKSKNHTYIYSKNKFGCFFENGITVFLSQLSSDMIVKDIFCFGIDKNIQTEKNKLDFSREDLFMAVDTVSSILGDTEGFIEFEPLGRNSDGFVWEVKGKTFVGLAASERVIGSAVEGDIVEGFGVSKKVFGKILKNSTAEMVQLVDLSSSMLGILIDDQVVYLMSKTHRG